MLAQSPDWRDLRAHLRGLVRAHRAQPVYLQTGRYAPPESIALWTLLTPGENVLEIRAYQGDREVTLRIVPDGWAR